MQINPHDVHVWSVPLTLDRAFERQLFTLLSVDERARAERFAFPIHQTRFIAARAALRQILANYTFCKPQEITFAYNEHHKPYLRESDLPLHFNLAHSDDWAIYAFTLNAEIGIDLEQITDRNVLAIAERHFTEQENQALKKLPSEHFAQGFYRIWSYKEALLKAIGKGLKISLSAFSVPVTNTQSQIFLENEHWTLVALDIIPGFQAALASNQVIHSLHFYTLYPEVQLHKVVELC